jgi:hypothetical protein
MRLPQRVSGLRQAVSPVNFDDVKHYEADNVKNTEMYDKPIRTLFPLTAGSCMLQRAARQLMAQGLYDRERRNAAKASHAFQRPSSVLDTRNATPEFYQSSIE